jgi:hypothetical protein
VAYSMDLKKSARRHFRSASILFESTEPGSQPGSRAVSGYLYGISGELAVKELMRSYGMRPLPPESRRDDPFYAHFPGLKTLIRDHARGRLAGDLQRIANDQKLFHHWSTDMRYAPAEDVESAWIADWKESADSLIQTMEQL